MTPTKKKKLRFYFHYNKPASRREGRPVLTFHYRGTCHRTHSISCMVPTETHERPSQPQVVVRGWANHVYLDDTDGEAVHVHIS
tara:strand:+ start:3198 stop:3449 length:252 start_codon:yes stop_codon:yes gene_type:complete